MSAIERCLQGREGGVKATQAARVLEQAVGRALGPAPDPETGKHRGGRGKKALRHDKEFLSDYDIHVFRLMDTWASSLGARADRGKEALQAEFVFWWDTKGPGAHRGRPKKDTGSVSFSNQLGLDVVELEKAIRVVEKRRGELLGPAEPGKRTDFTTFPMRGEG